MAPPSTVAGAPLSELKRSLPIPLERLLVPHRSPNLAITGRRWRILILPTKLGPRFRSCELRNLQILQKLVILQVSPKWPFWGFWPKPEKLKKTPFFGSVKKGAQSCGGSRRIIYCLDTRYGPQTTPPGGEFGGFPDPPVPGGVLDPSRRNAEFRISPKSGISGFCSFAILHRNGFRVSCFASFTIRSPPPGWESRKIGRGQIPDSNIAK